MAEQLEPSTLAAFDQASAEMRETILAAADRAAANPDPDCPNPLCAGTEVVDLVFAAFEDGGPTMVIGIACSALRLLGEARKKAGAA